MPDSDLDVGLTVERLPGGAARVAFTAEDGRIYRVEASDTLEALRWNPVGEAIAGGGRVEVEDPAAAAEARRFYRVILYGP
jgi:hypothetical protein